MVGYSESLTDPSYEGQLLCLTSPMVGNYGVPPRGVLDSLGLPSRSFESTRIHARGIVVQDYCGEGYSHWEASSSLGTWLKEENVVGLTGLDTRLLTKRIRETGSIVSAVR